MPLFGLTNNMLLVESVESVDLLEREREREREREDSKHFIITAAALHLYNLKSIHLPLKGIIHSF